MPHRRRPSAQARYGFLEFREVLELMEKHNFSATVAFIPLKLSSNEFPHRRPFPETSRPAAYLCSRFRSHRRRIGHPVYASIELHNQDGGTSLLICAHP
jgi:hypothetical protein